MGKEYLVCSLRARPAVRASCWRAEETTPPQSMRGAPRRFALATPSLARGPNRTKKPNRFPSARTFTWGDDGHGGGDLLRLDLGVLDLLAVAVGGAELFSMTSAGEGSRSARRWTEVAGIRETARRVEQDGNATVARCEDAAADPRGTLDGAFTRPIFEGSGFWGLSRAIEGIFRARRRTFLGRVLVWCLVAFGLTCRRHERPGWRGRR